MSHPDTMYWLEVHARFSQGNFVAGIEIIEHFLPWLCQRLLYRWPGVDAQLAAESAENALMGYLANSQRFNATLGVPLGYWLYIQTRGHLSHLLQKERTYHRHVQTIGVEDEDFAKIARIRSRKRPGDGYLLSEEEEQTDFSEEEKQLLTRFSPKEQDALILLEERVPKKEWIRLLDLEGLPPAAQERQINREKERIRKKRQRLRKGWGYPAVKGSLGREDSP